MLKSGPGAAGHKCCNLSSPSIVWLKGSGGWDSGEGWQSDKEGCFVIIRIGMSDVERGEEGLSIILYLIIIPKYYEGSGGTYYWVVLKTDLNLKIYTDEQSNFEILSNLTTDKPRNSNVLAKTTGFIFVFKLIKLGRHVFGQIPPRLGLAPPSTCQHHRA